MKISRAVAIVTFSLFLKIASVQGSFDTQFNAVKGQINLIQRITTTVLELQYGFFPQVLGFMALGQKNMSETVELHYNETVDHVQEWVRNSTAEGKNPSGCKATAISSFQTIRIKELRALDTCINIVKDWVYPIETALESNIEEAMKISSFLYSIFPSCYSTDVEEFESCIDQILLNATQIVDMYKTTTATYLIENQRTYQPVQDRMTNCLDTAESTLEEEWDTAKGDFAKCVMTL